MPPELKRVKKCGKLRIHKRIKDGEREGNLWGMFFRLSTVRIGDWGKWPGNGSVKGGKRTGTVKLMTMLRIFRLSPLFATIFHPPSILDERKRRKGLIFLTKDDVTMSNAFFLT